MATYPQNLVSALPIFDNWKKQTFRQPYCSGNGFIDLQMRYDRVLPWYILRPSTTAPTYVYLVNEDSSAAIDITSLLTILGDTVGDNDYVYCEGSADIDPDTEVSEHSGWNGTTWATSPGDTTWADFVCSGGRYYLEWNFSGTRYYSERFFIVDFPEFSDDPTDETTARVRIEAVTTCPIGDLPPLGSQKIFIASTTLEPDYEITRSVSEDGQGEQETLRGKVKKRYRIRWMAPESVADFISTLSLFGTVAITDQYGVHGNVSIVETKVTWGDDESGCAAMVEVVFARDFLTYTGCC